MKYDAIVVGGGISGLIATAYLSQAGHKPLLIEKEAACGGLVNSFVYDEFVYDGGIRALENSGVLFPMLKQLGIDIEFVKNKVSVGIEDQVIRVNSEESVAEYQDLLIHFYPESQAEIEEIILKIRQIMHYMDVQYGIDNPIFLDMKENLDYMLKVIVPWMFKYALTAPKITAMNEPMNDFLRQYTNNQALLDIITQHFFQETPAFFALSYLTLYLDYFYPKGGTGVVTQKLADFIEAHHGTIRTGTKIMEVDPVQQTVTDDQGVVYQYEKLVWAADNKTLYRLLNLEAMPMNSVKIAIENQQKLVADKIGNDSIFTTYLGTSLDKSYFEKIASEHFFYTPSRSGQTPAGPLPLGETRETIEAWLEKFFALTTYEIACPVLRDSTLAPQGKTGLIVSVLFDYQLTRQIENDGWYDEFKQICEKHIINTLDASIYPGIKKAIIHQFSSSPLTMAKIAGNTDGAITGWSFKNHPVPAESRLTKIMQSVKTPIPGVFQAGQWTYSPSGLPIAIMTGKIAADQVIKTLKKKK